VFGRLREIGERRLKERTLERWLRDPRVRTRVDEVLALEPESLGLDGGAAEERGLPGNAEFRQSGWSDHMILRYLLALDDARERRVLDSCSGLGWGSHIVSSIAGTTIGIDLDERAVGISRQKWGSPNLSFEVGSVLELPFENASFDVVLCMEAIEHFDRANGKRYLSELARVARPRGLLFGSSAFPETRRAADELCATNEFHLTIYTRREMAALLPEVFGKPLRLTHHYFAAVKAAR
jgi:2-polyprenyl-3-methyl-5-hydroxy-6-metoxy-1,4-benzoquinol methylase